MLLETGICQFGWKAQPFRLNDFNGQSFNLEDVRGPHGLLIAFICNHCPYVKAIINRLVSDAEVLKNNGIGVVAIMPNNYRAYPDDAPDKMKQFAQAHNFNFPYLVDDTQAVARAYDAVCTPDFFGFNADLELQYRGRLDEGRLDNIPNANRDLLNAMLGIKQTGHGPKDQIASAGCSIKWCT